LVGAPAQSEKPKALKRCTTVFVTLGYLLQRLLAELTPGRAKKDITVLQAKAVLASVRPRDIAGKTRRRVAADELADLVAIEKKVKALTVDIKAIVQSRGSN
jgi:transposase